MNGLSFLSKYPLLLPNIAALVILSKLKIFDFDKPLSKIANPSPISLRSNQNQKIRNNIKKKDPNIIDIIFALSTGEKFKLEAKLNEKFIDIFTHFKENDCPKELKDKFKVPLFDTKKIEIDKTISENNLKSGSIVLFMADCKEEIKLEDNNKQLNEREREQISKWRKEFNEKIEKEKSENSSEVDDLINKFNRFVITEKDINGVGVKEHSDRLTYCLTDFDWKCNVCNNIFKKNIPKYYCSVCDYNMCEECLKKGGYNIKKELPKSIPTNLIKTEKFIQTDYHEHRLAYCRTSRRLLIYGGWICDNCRESFNNETWSFYCTKCDFDLCRQCMGV